MQSISLKAWSRSGTRTLVQRVTIARMLGHHASSRTIQRATECVTPCSSFQRRSGTAPPVRAHRDRAAPAGVRPDARAYPQQLEQEADEGPHRRRPPRAPILIVRWTPASNTLTSRCPLGVLIMTVRFGVAWPIRPVLVPA